MLAARGHEVESAMNGSEGLKRLAAVMGTALDFDIVLCDFQMPVRSRSEPIIFCRYHCSGCTVLLMSFACVNMATDCQDHIARL